MIVYQYKAVDASGEVRLGRLNAQNTEELEQRLNRMGLDLVNFREVKPGMFRGYRRNVTRKDLINFCFYLEQLTEAGVPLLQGLADLRDSVENPRFREILSAVIARIEAGATLSEGLAEFPRIFDSVFVNLIRVGEQAGRLGEVMRNLTESLKWQDELASQARKVVTYPAIVGVVVLGVVGFLMVYLVPQLVKFIQTMQQQMPAHTRVLIATSDFIVAHWLLLVLVPVVGAILLRQAAARNVNVRYRVHALILRAPVLGEVLRKIILARFARFFGLMYSAGVPVLDAFRIIEKISGNLVIERALADVRRRVSEGTGISVAFEQTALFPPLVVRTLKVGETTGALDKALYNVSYFYDREIKERIGQIETMIEPALTVVLGGILAWIMLSVLGPIYDIISKIQF